MTTPKLNFAPEARALFDQAYQRARPDYLLWIFETASKAEAEQGIHDAFFEAAAVHELEKGETPAVNRVLDEGEARLALAQLELFGGRDGTIGASAARRAYRGLHQALDDWKAICCGADLGAGSPTERLIAKTADRAKGWRRVSRELTANEVKSLFYMKESELFDAAPGVSAVDGLFVYLMINDHVGGAEEFIPFTDTQWIANRLLGFAPLKT
jgi:hypothetical protein